MWSSPVARAIGASLLLGGCATQFVPPPVRLQAPGQWANTAVAASPSAVADERWWTRLEDRAITTLIDATLSDNPTLSEALARVDQARAIRDVASAGRAPRVGVDGAVSQGRQSLGSTGGSPVEATSASLSLNLGWEIDLWGRVRQTEQAAQSRLDARTADARAARLSVAAQIAGGVLRLRACNFSLAVRAEDIVSRRAELDLMRKRLALGNVAPVDVASAQSNLASAEIDRIGQGEACTREIDALVAISGVDAATIRSLAPAPSLPDADASVYEAQAAEAAAIIPPAPPMRPVLPATVLLNHPSVVAAEREAAARWAEIGVARAERLPRIDLAGILTGQWIRTSGSTMSLTTWSIGPQLSGVIFDGGAGAANVRNAEARYREAVATLQGALRTAIQEIEDGLAAQQSAEQRLARSRDAVAAARLALTANEARWRAGAISRFELEESRRQFNRAQESAIDAARDHATAWVELVRASGAAFELSGDPAPLLPSPATFAKPSR